MRAVEQEIREKIRLCSTIPFAEFMETALYGIDGYYRRTGASGSSPIGEAGDYVTGSALSPLFAGTTARLLRRLDPLLGGAADFLEVGFGGAEHLRHLAAELGDDALGEDEPASGWQHERRPEPQHGRQYGRQSERQPGRRLFAFDRGSGAELPATIDRLVDLSAISSAGLRGLVFSYELFDAQPVHRVIGGEGGQLRELCVGCGAEGEFRWVEERLSDPRLAELLGRLGVELEPGQIADLSLAWEPLYRQLAEALTIGLLVTVDYGYPSRALFDLRVRRHGTLACFVDQTVHRDPFRAVGDQDLTAHVDFSLLRSVGEAAGLETLGFTRQAVWLTELGLFDDLQAAPPQLRSEAQLLLHPDGMGTDLRVFVQGRGVDRDRLFGLMNELDSRLP